MEARSRKGVIAGLPGLFVGFLSGLTVSKLGDAIYTFAVPWVAYELTHSPVVMSTLYATEIVPVLLFGALIGVFLDHWDRRRLMLWADVARAVIVGVIPALHMLGALQIWHLYAAAFALSLISLAFDVATTAVIPNVAGQDLTRANAAHQLAMQAAGMAGPALAGLIIAGVGGFNALWVDAVSFGATFLAIWQIRLESGSTSGMTVRGVVQGMAEGVRWLWGNTVIKVLALQATIGNFGFGMVTAVLMYYLRSTLGLDARVSGLDYAMLGVGGVLGSLAIVPLTRRFRRGTLYPAILLFGMTGLLLMAAVRTWWAPGLGFGMVSACNVAWVVLSTSVRQEQIPPSLFGRVLSFTRTLSTAAMPVGATLGGLLMQRVDPSWVFLAAAATKAVEFGVARFSAMSKL
jgi:MFS family permease